jgi:hypothetical protein
MATPTDTMTALAAARPQPETPVQNLPAVRSGFDNSQSFELLQRGARLLASSSLVPQNYQGNIPNCVIALNMAQRIGADPLLVMQNLYLVHGRPGWSAQFLIACFNQCGRFSAIRYRWTATQADGDAWGCQAYAKELSTGEIIDGPTITLALAKKEGWYQKSGSKWQSIPQLMLMYRAAAWLVRTHAPEISMGLQTAEELGDVYDANRGTDGTYAIDGELGAPSTTARLDTLAQTPPQAAAGSAQAGDPAPTEATPPAAEKPAAAPKGKAKAKAKAAPPAPAEAPKPAEVPTGEITTGQIMAAIVRATTAEQVDEQLDLARGFPEAIRGPLENAGKSRKAQLGGGADLFQAT